MNPKILGPNTKPELKPKPKPKPKPKYLYVVYLRLTDVAGAMLRMIFFLNERLSDLSSLSKVGRGGAMVLELALALVAAALPPPAFGACAAPPVESFLDSLALPAKLASSHENSSFLKDTSSSTKKYVSPLQFTFELSSEKLVWSSSYS